MRFNQMQKALNSISSKTLTQKLKQLILSKVILRKVQNSIPVLITYELSDSGKELSGVMEAMAAWSNKWNMG